MRWTVLLLAVAALVAGCGSDDSSEGTTGGGEAAQTVEVSASDFEFDPSSLSVDAAGRTTFRLANDGGAPHALELEGNGIEEETEEIGPGESAELTVDLKEGEYEFYCPVGNHRSLGMEGTLVVSGGAASGAATTDDDGDGYGYGG